MSALASPFRKTLFVVTLLALMLVSSLALVPSSREAMAGSNGQQVVFSCGGLTSASISGENQAGRQVTWWGNAYAGSVVTSGWWFRGWVAIRYNTTWGSGYKSAWIPWVWGSNFYNVSC